MGSINAGHASGAPIPVRRALASRLDLAETPAAAEAPLRLGPVAARVLKPIVRCAATHVDPATGVRDIEVVRAPHDNYGHLHCGLYAVVTAGGVLADGDGVTLAATAP